MPTHKSSAPAEAFADLSHRLNRIERQLERVNGDVHLLSIRAACSQLGVRRSKDGPIHKAIRRGQLRVVKVGKRLKIRRGDLSMWLERQTL